MHKISPWSALSLVLLFLSASFLWERIRGEAREN